METFVPRKCAELEELDAGTIKQISRVENNLVGNRLAKNYILFVIHRNAKVCVRVVGFQVGILALKNNNKGAVIKHSER